MTTDLTTDTFATAASSSIDDDVFTEGALLPGSRPPSSILKPLTATPIDRKLRKFASESTFVQFDSLSRRSLDNDDVEIARDEVPLAPAPLPQSKQHQHRPKKPHKQVSMPTALTKRLFHVRPTNMSLIGGGNGISSRPATNGILGRIASSSSTTAAAVRIRDDSDDASASINSETTVQSGSMTPLSRQKMRFRLQRPKSASHMVSTTSAGDDSTNALNTSYTSATVHSLDSMIQPTMTIVDVDRRRPSNVFMIDDDSVHEFDDDRLAGRRFFLYLSFFYTRVGRFFGLERNISMTITVVN
jgi:hypothetical protein